MKRKLPPFAAVRAFEASARHGSFTKAAAELNVTQSAISHQVRRLEEFLDLPLFTRSTQKLRLTDAGRAYVSALTGILDQLDASTRSLREPGAPELLRIRATPAFTTRWLLPRMARFQAANPDLDYEISIGFPPTDFSQGDVDVFIHWGSDPVEGARVEPFFETARAPAASPAFLKVSPKIEKPEDLLRTILLHDKVEDGWASWFRSCDVVPPACTRGPRFEHCELALQAAEAGQGIVLPYLALVEEELRDGTLVRLFDQETPATVIYSLAYPDSHAEDAKIRAFRDWIFEEVEAQPAPQLRVVAGGEAG